MTTHATPSETLPARRTLYQIGDDHAALEDMLYELGGDISDDQVEAAIQEWMAEIQGDLAKKADGYICLIRNLESQAASRKAEADRLATLARVETNAAARLKDRLHQFMLHSGIQRIDTERFRITVAKNGGNVPLILDESVQPEQLPETFRRVRYEADKDAIRATLEAGHGLTFAKLGERGTRLNIK